MAENLSAPEIEPTSQSWNNSPLENPLPPNTEPETKSGTSWLLAKTLQNLLAKEIISANCSERFVIRIVQLNILISEHQNPITAFVFTFLYSEHSIN